MRHQAGSGQPGREASENFRPAPMISADPDCLHLQARPDGRRPG